jgi:hypothetical protein
VREKNKTSRSEKMDWGENQKRQQGRRHWGKVTGSFNRATCAFNDNSNLAGRVMRTMRGFEARNVCQPRGTAAMIEKG